MRLLWIDMENFLAFGKARVALDRQGLVAVLGQNRDAAAADSNGAAKSSILEGIVWCFWGKTMRGLAADEVMHRRVKENCRVTVHIEDDNGAEWEVCRTRGVTGVKRPNDLQIYCNGKVPENQGGVVVDVQEQIDTLLGMDMDTFVQSVLMSFGTKPYSELSDGEQKSVLEAILHVDQYAKGREVVSARIKKRQLELATVRTEYVSTASQVSNVRVRLDKLQTSYREHETLLLQRLTELRKRKAECEAKIEEQYHATGLDALLDAARGVDDKLQELRNAHEQVQTKVVQITRTCAAKRNEMVAQRATLEAQRHQYDHWCTTLNQLAGKSCPTCRRDYDAEQADAELTVTDDQIKIIDEKLGVMWEAEEKLRDVEAKLLREQEQERQLLRESINVNEVRAREMREKVQHRAATLQLIQQLEQESWNLEREIETIDFSTNPYQQLVSDAQQELAQLVTKSKRLNFKERALDIEIKHLLFWEHGFGNQGIKHYVIESVLPFLSERAQHYVDIMSGGDMTIHFESGRQLKNKKWADEFRVCVENAQGAEVYKGNSDGEKGRINLCVGWALGDLAAQRAKKSIRFKALDEPFEHLDETGEDLVMKFLNAVVADCETILCITHSDHLKNQFPKVLTVVKEGGFSRVEE